MLRSFVTESGVYISLGDAGYISEDAKEQRFSIGDNPILCTRSLTPNDRRRLGELLYSSIGESSSPSVGEVHLERVIETQKAEIEKLKGEKAEIETRFDRVVNDKYAFHREAQELQLLLDKQRLENQGLNMRVDTQRRMLVRLRKGLKKIDKIALSFE